MAQKVPPTLDELIARMAALHEKLRRRKLTVAAAESCTGGLLGAVLTAHGGSSEYFRGGAVVADVQVFPPSVVRKTPRSWLGP